MSLARIALSGAFFYTGKTFPVVIFTDSEIKIGLLNLNHCVMIICAMARGGLQLIGG